jgi:hypothetical protein
MSYIFDKYSSMSDGGSFGPYSVSHSILVALSSGVYNGLIWVANIEKQWRYTVTSVTFLWHGG